MLQHCCNDDGTTRPLLLVTAAVDRMVLKKPILLDTDLKIVGAVTWVGRSSMEIQLEVIQSMEGTLLTNNYCIHESAGLYSKALCKSESDRSLGEQRTKAWYE